MTGPDLKQALQTLAMRLGQIEFWLTRTNNICAWAGIIGSSG